MKYKRAVFISVLIISLLTPSIALADQAPYKGYNYSWWNEAVPSPNGYLPEKTYSGTDIGSGELKTPQDLATDKNGNVYILDSGNKRLLILDINMKLKKEIRKFISGQKEETLGENAGGLFVSENGSIYIADTGNKRILVSDTNGNITKIYNRPETTLIDQSQQFEPRKVVVDSSGILYVISNNISQGAIMIGINNEFLGFYGMNPVESSVKLLAEQFWRKFQTKEQTARTAKFQPVEYSNMDIDSKDFIYTVTKSANVTKGQLKKLNPIGNNIFPNPNSFYGDYEIQNDKDSDKNELSDVETDKDGFIYALDTKNGKVFQYDQNGTLIQIFGGMGNQVGTFKIPVAIESLGEKIIVLDEGKCNITVFRESDFGATLRKAVIAYNKGKYEEALEPWKEVLKMNSNYDLAYAGIGKAQMLMGDYPEALKNLELGNDKTTYSAAKKKYRTQILRNHFTEIMLGTFGLIILLRILIKRKRANTQKRGGKAIES